MILLFVSPQNPLWSDILSPDKINQQEICKIIGVSHGTIPNWKKGGTVSSATVERAFKRTIDHLKIFEVIENSGLKVDKLEVKDESQKQIPKEILQSYVERIKNNNLTAEIIQSHLTKVSRFSSAYSKATSHIYEIADILSISINQCQMIIDEAIYERQPVFPNMYQDVSGPSSHNAGDQFNQFRGVYHALVRRDDVWLRCPLRVRYLLKIRDGLTIRCKLNLPIIESERHQKYWEYDGFLIVRDWALFWFFEKRASVRTDYFSFISNHGRPFRGKLTMSGTYLTTGQGANQPIIKDDIFLQRIEIEDMGRMESAMHMDAGVVEGSDCESIERMLADFKEA